MITSKHINTSLNAIVCSALTPPYSNILVYKCDVCYIEYLLNSDVFETTEEPNGLYDNVQMIITSQFLITQQDVAKNLFQDDDIDDLNNVCKLMEVTLTLL